MNGPRLETSINWLVLGASASLTLPRFADHVVQFIVRSSLQISALLSSEIWCLTIFGGGSEGWSFIAHPWRSDTFLCLGIDWTVTLLRRHVVGQSQAVVTNLYVGQIVEPIDGQLWYLHLQVMLVTVRVGRSGPWPALYRYRVRRSYFLWLDRQLLLLRWGLSRCWRIAVTLTVVHLLWVAEVWPARLANSTFDVVLLAALFARGRQRLFSIECAVCGLVVMDGISFGWGRWRVAWLLFDAL